jgi:hypothetical protein
MGYMANRQKTDIFFTQGTSGPETSKQCDCKKPTDGSAGCKKGSGSGGGAVCI